MADCDRDVPTGRRRCREALDSLGSRGVGRSRLTLERVSRASVSMRWRRAARSPPRSTAVRRRSAAAVMLGRRSTECREQERLVGPRLLGVARLVEAGGSPLVCRGGGLECRDRLPDEAGDVHLGDPEAVSDLGLGEVVLEAQSEDDALAVGERVEQSVDERGVLDALEAGLCWRRGSRSRRRRRR